MNIAPLEIILGIVILIVVFLLLREWFTWYWKINGMLWELQMIRKSLQRIEVQLKPKEELTRQEGQISIFTDKQQE